MNAKYKLKHCCIWRPNCFAQEENGTAVAPNVFCFNKVTHRTQSPFWLQSVTRLPFRWDRKHSGLNGSLESLSDKNIPKPPLPPLYKHVQSEKTDLSDWQHLYLKQLALGHGLRDTLSYHSNRILSTWYTWCVYTVECVYGIDTFRYSVKFISNFGQW